MDYRARYVAGTALALILGAATLPASASLLETERQNPATAHSPSANDVLEQAPILLAQAEDEELTEEEKELRRRLEEQLREQEQEEEEEERAAEPIPGQPEQPPATEAPPPQTEKPRPPAQEEAPPAQPPAQEEAPPAEPPAGGAEPIPGAPEQPPATEAPPPQTEAPQPPAQGEVPPAQPPAEPPAGGAEPIPGAPEQPPASEAPPPQTEKPRPPAQEEAPPAPPPAQPPAGGAEPIPGQPPATQPPATQPPATQPPEAQPPATQPPATQPPSAPGGVEPVQEGQAPILDSQKEQAREGEPAPAQAPAAEAPPPPATDAEAREAAQPAEVMSVREEEGTRIERIEQFEQRQLPQEAEVLREIGDRIVIQINNQIIVESDDRERMGRDAEEVYYEELPRGRVRETIVRPNGVQVVTIRNRYGDVIQRSRIMPDGREYFLVYAEEYDDRGPRGWIDPALDLPPLVLTIPAEEYILDAERAVDPDVYYRFLDQPPVERVQRLYSIDEVKYSARVRDSVRRIDLDTITFEFGSASISDTEIPRLENLAIAMERMLEENPAETFLIEGHTDAVGSNVANLALSDRRAESVAAALTNVFGIPPENLVTQGYGEEYLKIRTEAPERENRRVAVRRITPLVSPVASSQ